MKRWILGMAYALLFLSDSILAAEVQNCEHLRGRGAAFTSLPPYEDVLEIFNCVGMSKDVAELDALDRDLMFMFARNLSLEEWRKHQTKTDPPRKFSSIATPEKLAKFKMLVDDYYRP